LINEAVELWLGEKELELVLVVVEEESIGKKIDVSHHRL
jgi:hypothetical protein